MGAGEEVELRPHAVQVVQVNGVCATSTGVASGTCQWGIGDLVTQRVDYVL